MNETPASSPLVLPILVSTPPVLRAMLSELPDPLVTEITGDGGWSARDVVAHLLDRWSTQCRRLDAMLTDDHPMLPDEDEAASLERSGLRALGVESLLAELERARRERVTRYAALTAEQLARTGQHATAGAVTVAEMLNHIAYHDLDHVQQIAGILASVAHESRGAMQRF